MDTAQATDAPTVNNPLTQPVYAEGETFETATPSDPNSFDAKLPVVKSDNNKPRYRVVDHREHIPENTSAAKTVGKRYDMRRP